MCDCCSVEKEKDIYLPEPASINACRMLNGTEMYMHIGLDSGKPLGHAPGQFVEVSVAGIGEAPLTVASSPTQSGFELVVRNVGRVSGAMHGMTAGHKLGIRGPFGSIYPVDEMKGRDLVFICGGIGLVPQRAFINYVLDNRSDYGEVVILQGTKCYADRLFCDEVAEWCARDDVQLLETIDLPDKQWDGNVGVVTTLIPKIGVDLKKAGVLVCGPPIMYKFVLMSLMEQQVPMDHVFLNLERRMKCGVGKCGHCQINGLYVCQSGPVYRYSDLAGVPEAI
ncbi:MAG: FAD/NAD(P)-binding protein [Phycisphaerae bacterium]|nr:FAD/NAD(P)-binding protein [Phycisphaerae bacterium]